MMMSGRQLQWSLIVGLLLLYVRLTVGQIEELPDKFEDERHLPRVQSDAEKFKVLGGIRKLPTFTKPQDVSKIETRYSIVNQFMQTDDIVFKQDEQFQYRNGSYPLDLRKLLLSRFDPSKRTVILIPGYLSNDIEHEPWLQKMKETWILLEDMNVILVSWRANNRYVYDRAVANTPFVARQISVFLYYLSSLMGVDLHDEQFLRKVHLIGHSLGAHISGFVGKDLAGKVGRISGLDPAGPSFDKFPTHMRLHYSDAILVEAFHTNAGRMRYVKFGGSSLLKGFGYIVKTVPGMAQLAHAMGSQYSGEGDTAWYGIEDQVGHIDYYVNDGRTQPGCSGLMHLCDHNRAHQVFQNFLEYELLLKRAGNRTSEDRFLAFKANQPNEFSVGSNFREKCPSLLAGSQSWSSDNHRDDTFRRCSLPIDLVGDLDHLQSELTNDYKIDLINGTNNAKYYLKTRNDQESLVGDHYLLKVHLARDPIWTENCMFRAEVISQAGHKTEVKLNKQFQIIDHKHNYEFKGVAIPFIHPNGPVAHKDLNEIFTKLNNSSSSSWREERGKIDLKSRFKIYTHVPESVVLYVSNSETTGITETVGSWLRFRRDTCELEISAIEIQPISPSWHTFISNYRPVEEIPDIGAKIKVYHRERLASKLKFRYKLLKEPEPEVDDQDEDEDDDESNSSSSSDDDEYNEDRRPPVIKLERNSHKALNVSEILLA